MTFGLAEFVAAEEMGRSRGYWWSPDGSQLLIARVDESAVARWHIADPANPGQAPVEVAYPAAGTANADVSLLVATAATNEDARSWPGSVLSVVETAPASLAEQPGWDRAAFPYLVSAAWDNDLLIVVQTRDQRTMRVINGLTGQLLREDTDPDWTDVIDGVPAQLDGGDIVWTAIGDDTRRLIVAPPPPWPRPSPSPRRPAGTGGARHRRRRRAVRRVHRVHRARRLALRPRRPQRGRDRAGRARRDRRRRDHRARQPDAGQQRPAFLIVRGRRGHRGHRVARRSSRTCPHPAPRFLEAGPAGIRTAVLLPSWHQPGTKLPVLMDPYGGPGAQRVVKAASMYLTSQWFAEQGFAVVVADGRGTPGRGPAWERTIAGDFASGILEDQVTALSAAAGAVRRPGHRPGSGIRGWSFGGYLSALAVLRRPDVFHAGGGGRAGRPTGGSTTPTTPSATWATRRRIPTPTRRVPLLDDPARAVQSVIRPLLIIHGLADDNVFVAHSLRLSQRAARRRVPALGAAAVRDHAHDVAGGGRGEHAAVPGRVPEAGARPPGRGRVAGLPGVNLLTRLG